MRKLSILLLIILSIQLYGCSAHESGINEMTPSASEVSSQEPETLPIEETVIKEVEPHAEEIRDDNSGTPTEQKDNSATDYNIDNADNSVQDMTLQTEETAATVDDGYYSIATNLSCLDVESYAARVKQLFLEHDWSAISSEISYPITISDITYNNSADFLDASNSFDSSLEEDFFSVLEKENCTEMFCNWEGIMLGETGQIWISEVLDSEFNSQGLKITAVNGMLK